MRVWSIQESIGSQGRTLSEAVREFPFYDSRCTYLCFLQSCRYLEQERILGIFTRAALIMRDNMRPPLVLLRQLGAGVLDCRR